MVVGIVVSWISPGGMKLREEEVHTRGKCRKWEKSIPIGKSHHKKRADITVSTEINYKNNKNIFIKNKFWGISLEKATITVRDFSLLQNPLISSFNYLHKCLFFLLESLPLSQTHLSENDFLCDQIIAFDGGGSSQIMCKGVSKLSSSRPIPVAIVVKESEY